MSAEGLYIDGVEGLAAGHEQAIASRAAKADVAADLGEEDLADAFAFGIEDMDAVVAIADLGPSGAGPHIAVGVAPDAVGEAGGGFAADFEGHGAILAAFGEFTGVDDVVSPDVFGRLGVMGSTGIGDVERAIIGRKAQAVGLEEFVCDHGDGAIGRVDAVDGFLEKEFALEALVIADAPVAGIGEPDAAIWMNDHIVGSVEGFAIKLLGEDGDGAIAFVADHAPGAVFAGNLSAFAIEGIAVAVVGWISGDADMAVFGQPAELDVIGDIAPDEIAADAAPGGSFGPEGAGVEAFDGRATDFVFGEGRIDDNHVGFGVADGFGGGGVAAFIGGEERHGSDGAGSGCSEE